MRVRFSFILEIEDDNGGLCRIQGMVFQAPKSEREDDPYYHVEYGHTAQTEAYELEVVWDYGEDG